jgi:hypothetical protein
MNDVFIMKGDIGLSESCAIPGVKGRIPLFVFVAETHDSHVTFFNQGFRANGSSPDLVVTGGSQLRRALLRIAPQENQAMFFFAPAPVFFFAQ